MGYLRTGIRRGHKDPESSDHIMLIALRPKILKAYKRSQISEFDAFSRALVLGNVDYMNGADRDRTGDLLLAKRTRGVAIFAIAAYFCG